MYIAAVYIQVQRQVRAMSTIQRMRGDATLPLDRLKRHAFGHISTCQLTDVIDDAAMTSQNNDDNVTSAGRDVDRNEQQQTVSKLRDCESVCQVILTHFVAVE